jgi:hypothetical protein
MIERSAQFFCDARGQPPLTDKHDRVQLVAESPEMFFLLLGKRHRRIIGAGKQVH